MNSNIDINNQLTAMRVNTLNFNLDNAINSFLLFYIGYDAVTGAEERGYCDVVASDVVNVFNGEFPSLSDDTKKTIEAFILSTFNLYKKDIRQTIEEKLAPIRNAISLGEEVNEELLIEATNKITASAGENYNKHVESLLSEIAKYSSDNDGYIRNYLYQDVFSKIIRVLENKLSSTMGVTKNSFDESADGLKLIDKTNAEILANVQKVA